MTSISCNRLKYVQKSTPRQLNKYTLISTPFCLSLIYKRSHIYITQNHTSTPKPFFRHPSVKTLKLISLKSIIYFLHDIANTYSDLQSFLGTLSSFLRE
ncbi:hypothetical protein L2E82_27613 [Cichorium intybus]|uniref:Uncharacterized protein n=1 Tax=Cichorium intybus TaxID=13427 RepID=A0ACB9CTM3_CICIN|nr:hypothetical protein L2E82_27613 [Cichorium intybus]